MEDRKKKGFKKNTSPFKEEQKVGYSFLKFVKGYLQDVPTRVAPKSARVVNDMAN